jgi:phosphoesterase RecJ-like protein
MMTRAVLDPEVAVDRLKKATRALLTSHRRPDGDALGSELALAELADRLSVATVILNRDPAPSSLGQLPGSQQLQVADSLPHDFPEGFDLVVTLECTELERTGFDHLDRVAILNIDHHRANPMFGEVNYVDEASPAVGELVWRMFTAAGIDPSPAAATNAYVALSTDTGDFRYSNATGRAFRAAAEMVDAGADPAQVSTWIHESRNLASVRLLGEALKTLTLGCDGRLATVEIDPAAFERCEATPADSEEIINHPRSIAGVQAVAFFKQWEPGVVQVSLRSKDDIDVRRVASTFGGGGHTNAAGCTLNGQLSSAREQVTAELARLLESTP